MLTYYFAKGSGALAAHILLEEIGAEYQTIPVSIPDKEHQSPDYLAINPKGRIPSLVTPQGVLTENPAILAYLAQTHPEAGLIPSDPWAFAKAQELNAYIASTAHIAFAHKQRGARWSDDPETYPAMQAKVAENMRDCAEYVQAHYAFTPWVLGEGYTACDPYVFQLGRWVTASGLDLSDFPKLQAHAEQMRARPATQRALAAHGLG
ncbi:glutathione S-transferase family protein [Ruegeria sp.]|uniref:glutathione S-transferase family protein n=1 Tax=Ruegeria sp. TaxID=1879320 RepID=UPI00231590F9|nr:glutathione S-transferase family protein [Ruegeria sp.]MDA7963462.1 glutathione S-transferase family protein [Ruegeria sp.]